MLFPLQFSPDPVREARNSTVTPHVSSSAPKETRRENITTKVSNPASKQVLRDIAYKFRIRPERISQRRGWQPTKGVQWYEHGHDVHPPQGGQESMERHNHMPLVSGKPSMPSVFRFICSA